MDTGEPNPISQNLHPKERAVEAPIPEIDLTGKDLPTIHAEMTRSIQQGRVLHGTPRADLSVLIPKYSIDLLKGNQTAVFASDQPTIPIARAIGGDNLSLWTSGHLFQVRDGTVAVPRAGYVYELPAEQFTRNLSDQSELTSENPVKPLRKFKFDDVSIAQSFRTKAELDQLVSNEGTYHPEHMRPIDLTNVLLVIRNLLTLAGDISFVTYGDPREDYFLRLETVTKAAAPIIEQAPHLTNSMNGTLIKEVLGLYENSTYDIYNIDNSNIYISYGGMNHIFKKLAG